MAKRINKSNGTNSPTNVKGGSASANAGESAPMVRAGRATRHAAHDDRAAHRFDRRTDFCTACGAHRTSVWLDEWPARCPAGPNVIAISHLLALRHIARGAATVDGV